jgi:transposase
MFNNPARFRLTNKTRRQLEGALSRAEHRGDLPLAQRLKAVLALGEGMGTAAVARVLRVSVAAVASWLSSFLRLGLTGLRSKRSPGRPPKLTKTQKRELKRLVIAGPEAAGFPGACWRTPMIQALIHDRFGVFYSVKYISELLKNTGLSYQKAKFVADHMNPEKRREWVEKTWPEISNLAKAKNASIMFGDEVSFPQWGSLTYTWALRGKQPTIKTSGKRRGYKVFGLIDYFTGRFFCKGHAQGRLNSESYASFLRDLLSKTRKHIILVQDGAKYHVSKAMKEFFAKHADRLTVYQLPSYSPDYNPIEKLWKKIKERDIHPTFRGKQIAPFSNF